MEPRAVGAGFNAKKVLATGDTNAASIIGSASSLYGYDLYNVAAYAVYVHFYDKATAPTVGTDVPKFTIGIATASGRSVQLPAGIKFQKGLAFGITKAASDTDATAVVAGDVTGAIWFK